MKWLLCPLLLSVLVLAGCGGSASSPSSTPSRSPIVECTGDLPDGKISFRGRVIGIQAPTPYQAKLSVSVQRLSGQPGTAVHGNEQDWVNSVLNVTWIGRIEDESHFKSGDCVLGSGFVQEYLTHPPGTLTAFVARRLIKGEATTGETRLPPRTRQAITPREWLVGTVL